MTNGKKMRLKCVAGTKLAPEKMGKAKNSFGENPLESVCLVAANIILHNDRIILDNNLEQLPPLVLLALTDVSCNPVHPILITFLITAFRLSSLETITMLTTHPVQHLSNLL